MKRAKKDNKEFKIIPETKMVTGEKYPKLIDSDFIYGVKEAERKIIGAAGDELDIIWDSYWIDKDEEKELIIRANAYCDERDEWNEKTGIEVCSSKLDMKNHYRLAKQYSRIYRLLQETAATVYRLCEMHVKKAKAIEDDLVNHYGRLKV